MVVDKTISLTTLFFLFLRNIAFVFPPIQNPFDQNIYIIGPRIYFIIEFECREGSVL